MYEVDIHVQRSCFCITNYFCAVMYYYSPLQMQITLDYSLCSPPHTPNVEQSQVQGQFGIIPLQRSTMLLNYWTLLTGTLCYFMMSILTGQSGKTTSCRSWKSVLHSVVKVKRNLPWVNKSVVKALRRRNTLFHMLRKQASNGSC